MPPAAVLIPTLKPGDIVVMDNLPAQKAAAVGTRSKPQAPRSSTSHPTARTLIQSRWPSPSTKPFRLLSRDLPRGSIRLNGPKPLYWLRAAAPSEVLEVTASPALRRAIAAEIGASANCDLGDVHGWEDRLAWAILARFRLALRGGPPLTDLERDELMRRLYTHVYQVHFGGRAPRETSIRRGLDTRRLRRVTDHIEANLSGELSIAGLADAAAFSPFHFARCFRRVTGLAPHQFVTARRIERARALLLETGESVEAIAFAVGFTNLRHFRRLFQAQIGVLPSAFRVAHVKTARTDPAPPQAACFPRPDALLR